ncbi:MAG: LamG-like jellyroll fold domain-containing protein [Verrucomicrobiota bacterium]
MSRPTRLLLAALLLACSSVLHAQTPRVRLQFDGNLNESSGAGLVTAVTPSAGYTPGYATDRNGTANGAVVFTAGQSLTLEASSLVGNSNQALGLRNAAGTNTSFTMCAWVMFTSLGSGQGYSTIFGNTGTGTGTLHAGLNTNAAVTHLGFDSNDLIGGSATLVTNVWYHIAFTYDTTASNGQRIYINGIPDATRTTVTNTLKVADLILGNHGATTDTSNDFKGRLDDVVVYNTALKGDQILALANGVSPASVPAVNTYFPPASAFGYRGTTGMWGIREIKAYPGIAYNSLVSVDRILKAYATTPGGTKVDYWAPVINFTDDESPGTLGYFDSEGDFATNTPGADDNILMFARCSIKIPTAGNYTFGFRSDDGARLRVVGQRFTGSTRLAGGNADPANMSDVLLFSNGTGDSNTMGVVNLAAGEYDLEFSYWEGGGGCAVEVYAAAGSKTSFDAAFQLIGNVAAGGLEIVRDSDTVPTFTANGGPSVFVHTGSPANFTLAWSVNEPTTTLSIDQGIGAVASTGSLVLPSPASTTTYTITATTGPDVVTRSVMVYVNSAPVIPSFTANDTTVLPNGAVTLNWST